jgi:hypothetical protein
MNRTNMVKSFVIALALTAAAGQALAASAVNLDNEPRTIIVTEGGNKQEITMGAGETVEFCSGGCFVTMPNGGPRGADRRRDGRDLRRCRQDQITRPILDRWTRPGAMSGLLFFDVTNQ